MGWVDATAAVTGAITASTSDAMVGDCSSVMGGGPTNRAWEALDGDGMCGATAAVAWALNGDPRSADKLHEGGMARLNLNSL